MANIVLYLVLFLSSSAQLVFSIEPTDKAYVKKQLALISPEDKETLTLYFETLLSQNFAYTIFGDKPVSEDNYFALVDGDRSYKQTFLSNGKKVWQKYSHLFPLTKFFFKFQRTEDFEDIILVNKQAFLDTANAHLSIFKNILGGELDANSLLTKIMNADTTYADSLHHHSGLIGLLYGFGYCNAFIHFKQNQLNQQIEKFISPPFTCFNDSMTGELMEEIRDNPVYFLSKAVKEQKTEKYLKIPESLQSLFEEEESGLAMQNFNKEEDPLSLTNINLFPLPAFGADLSSFETKKLHEQYTNTRHKIILAYSGDDFLEVTLCKLLER
jgi:hypothetical protein